MISSPKPEEYEAINFIQKGGRLNAEYRPMSKILGLMASRKFWAAVIGLALIIIQAYRPDFPLSAETLTNVVYILVAYILGVAIEDSGLVNLTRK